MKVLHSLITIFAIASATTVFAKGKAPNECKQIAAICKNAGFSQGDWKKGDGLWRDCVDPIIQGVTVVPGATNPLPAVDASLIAACKAKHPKYGAGKVGSVK